LNGLANGAADIAMNAANISFAGSTHLTKPSAVLTLAQSNSGAFATQLGRIDAVIDQLLTFRAEVGSLEQCKGGRRLSRSAAPAHSGSSIEY
jgi:flagellin-like hook-associated protein FlgL